MSENQNLTKPSTQSTDTALFDAVSKGFVAMLARNLRYPPDRKNMGEIVRLLVEDLKAEGISDPETVMAALDKIGRNETDWPSTATIIKTVKPKKYGTTLGYQAIEYKKPTDDKKQKKI